jgi:ferritin-like metal-binding protein YciE
VANLKRVVEMFQRIFKSFNERLTRIEDHQITTHKEINLKLDRILEILGENGKAKRVDPDIQT